MVVVIMVSMCMMVAVPLVRHVVMVHELMCRRALLCVELDLHTRTTNWTQHGSRYRTPQWEQHGKQQQEPDANSFHDRIRLARDA
jgi:hypothetical protein